MTALTFFLLAVIVVEFIFLVIGERGWREALDGWTRAIEAWEETNQEWYEKAAAVNRDWGKYAQELIRKWTTSENNLLTGIGDLREEIKARDYVIGALKTQVKDAQQAGMTLQIENAKLRRLADWATRPEAHAALMAEYARAGLCTEGMTESNIPY